MAHHSVFFFFFLYMEYISHDQQHLPVSGQTLMFLHCNYYHVSKHLNKGTICTLNNLFRKLHVNIQKEKK